jgi:Skp family chaperone for outer membrane proteins
MRYRLPCFITALALLFCVQGAQAQALAKPAADQIAYEALKPEASEDTLSAFIKAYPNSIHSIKALERIARLKIAQLRALEAQRDDPKLNLSADGRAKLEADIKSKNLEMTQIGQRYADAVARGFNDQPIAAQAPSAATVNATPALGAPVRYPLGQTWVYKK